MCGAEMKISRGLQIDPGTIFTTHTVRLIESTADERIMRAVEAGDIILVVKEMCKSINTTLSIDLSANSCMQSALAQGN